MADKFIKLSANDNVLISLIEDEKFNRGFKYAEGDLQVGDPIIKYGNIIGNLSCNVNAMELVHVHNIETEKKTKNNNFDRLVSNATCNKTVQLYFNERTGSFGTRKNILIVSSVACVNRVVEQISRAFEGQRDCYTKVIAITHNGGCGLVVGGQDHEILKYTLNGYATNPNTFHMVLVGLGCEDNQFDSGYSDLISYYKVQEFGETSLINSVVTEVNQKLNHLLLIDSVERPLSDVTFALQCGGSDAFSAITANPLVGYTTTALVSAGSTVILAETPEVRGFEAQLIELCKNQNDKYKLAEIFKRWDDDQLGFSNPAPGNFSGGISTYLEKSIGSILKFGFNEIDQVLNFGEKPKSRSRMCFMDSPGYDPCSITGQIASGATCVIFTTGRGSNYKNSYLPLVKVGSNTNIAERYPEFIDVDAEALLKNLSIDKATEELLNSVVTSINKCDDSFIHSDFVPWTRGGIN